MTRISNRVRRNLRPQDLEYLDFMASWILLRFNFIYIYHCLLLWNIYWQRYLYYTSAWQQLHASNYARFQQYCSGCLRTSSSFVYTDQQLELLANPKNWFMDVIFLESWTVPGFPHVLFNAQQEKGWLLEVNYQILTLIVLLWKKNTETITFYKQ